MCPPSLLLQVIFDQRILLTFRAVRVLRSPISDPPGLLVRSMYTEYVVRFISIVYIVYIGLDGWIYYIYWMDITRTQCTSTRTRVNIVNIKLKRDV